MLTKSLLVWMLHFAVAYSPYDVPKNELPTVTFMRDSQLAKQCESTEAAACTNLYGATSGYIYMPVRCAPMASVECRGFLIHELTHWLQVKANQFHDQECIAPLEKEAYFVENKYYNLKGETLNDYGIPPWFLAQLTSCHTPYENGKAAHQ